MANTEVVLIADDEPEDLRFLVDIVRGDGFEVHSATNGVQASEFLDQHRFDLVITDLVMPGMSGFELMRLAHARNPEVICIALTGFGSLESAVDALHHGAYTYLVKPCDPGTFRNHMQRGLEKQRLTKELRLRNQELEKLNRELDSRVQSATQALQILNLRMRTEMASLQEVDRLKSAFLANVSHDLKSPMTTVMGYAEFLLEDQAGALPPQKKACAQNLTKAAEHMQYLVNQLVEAARLTSGKIDLKLQPVGAAELIEEAAALVRGQADSKGLRLESAWEGGEAIVLQVDRGRIMQVLCNLLDNAVKFTAPGGRVRLHAASESGQVHFCVEDTGVGIALQHQARIFERFYQVDPAPGKAFKGLGLGLGIAKDIVELHGGRIWAESEPGGGCHIHFTLPGSAAPARDSAA